MSENMNETMNENEGVTVTLTLDNDEVVECAVLTIFSANGQDYIALLPLDEKGEPQDGDVYLYRYIETIRKIRSLKTSRMMTNTRLSLTLSTSGWTPRTSKT